MRNFLLVMMCASILSIIDFYENIAHSQVIDVDRHIEERVRDRELLSYALTGNNSSANSVLAIVISQGIASNQIKIDLSDIDFHNYNLVIGDVERVPSAQASLERHYTERNCTSIDRPATISLTEFSSQTITLNWSRSIVRGSSSGSSISINLPLPKFLGGSAGFSRNSNDSSQVSTNQGQTVVRQHSFTTNDSITRTVSADTVLKTSIEIVYYEEQASISGTISASGNVRLNMPDGSVIPIPVGLFVDESSFYVYGVYTMTFAAEINIDHDEVSC